MMPRTRQLALVTAMLGSTFGLTGRAEAEVVLTTPAGLAPSDPFRFIFITDATTVATSLSIATYNTFVNTQAGGAIHDDSVVTWDAIGSTALVSAINNVGQTATPVHLADGTLIATSTTGTGLWSGSLSNPIDEDLSGMGVSTGSTGVWTGTNADGSASSNHLGDFFGVTIGASTTTDGTWTNDGVWSSDNTSGTFHIYGISQVLVAASVPEPSTLFMAVTTICAGSTIGWSRRRDDRRR